MKKNFFLFICSLVTFISCTNDNSNNFGLDELYSSKLVLSADTILFQGEDFKTLQIAIDKLGKSQYKITSYPEWVDVSPLSGILSQEIETIELQSKSEPSKPGVYEGDLTIVSQSETKTVHLKRFVGECLLYELPRNIDISYFDLDKKFSIKNTGNVDITYSATVSSDFITLSSSQGQILTGSEENITLNINRDLLESGSYLANIYIDLNDKKDTILVNLENIIEKKIFLNSDVVDAEFSKTTNKIIYVSSDPLILGIYDVTKKTSESISLAYIPKCVSISSNGDKAVVGHDGHLTYIDLKSKEIISTFDLNYSVSDIALGDNWAYMVQENNSSWTYLQSINLTIGSNSSGYGNSFYGGSKIKIHPSGKYIYLDHNSSSGRMYKYNIQDGYSDYLYDSSYDNSNGSSNVGMEFSEDGKRCFVMSGTVLKLSESQSQDIAYNGAIKGIQNIVGIAHSSQKSNLYLINQITDYWDSSINSFIFIYNANNLAFKKQIALERYAVKSGNSGNSYRPTSHFVFTNTEGDKVYVLTDSPESGILHSWAVQELNID